jgi:hypothetical protein
MAGIRSFLGNLLGRVSLSPRPGRGARRGARGLRPELVPLETRTAPATVTWLSPVGGDWDTGPNWAGGRVPGPNDTAVIPFRGITVTHTTAAADTAAGLDSEAALDISAGSLTITGFGQPQSRLDALATVTGGTLSFFNSNVTGAGTLRNFASLNLGNIFGEEVVGTANVAVDNEAGVLTVFGQINNDVDRPFVNGKARSPPPVPVARPCSATRSNKAAP